MATKAQQATKQIDEIKSSIAAQQKRLAAAVKLRDGLQQDKRQAESNRDSKAVALADVRLNGANNAVAEETKRLERLMAKLAPLTARSGGEEKRQSESRAKMQKELEAIKTTRSGIARSRQEKEDRGSALFSKPNRTKQEDAEVLRLELEMARLNNQDWSLKDRQTKIELALQKPG
jgi:chromosome segregation ATPase